MTGKTPAMRHPQTEADRQAVVDALVLEAVDVLARAMLGDDWRRRYGRRPRPREWRVVARTDRSPRADPRDYYDLPEPEPMPPDVAEFVESMNRLAVQHAALVARRRDKVARLPFRCRIGRATRGG
jgi:hypothetical protein